MLTPTCACSAVVRAPWGRIGAMNPDAKLLLELRERGYIDAADALEICGRCWRRADRALRELTREGVVKKADGRRRQRSRWTFVG